MTGVPPPGAAPVPTRSSGGFDLALVLDEGRDGAFELAGTVAQFADVPADLIDAGLDPFEAAVGLFDSTVRVVQPSV